MGWWASMPWWVWLLGGMFFISKVLHWRAWRWRARHYMRPGMPGMMVWGRGRCGAWRWQYAAEPRAPARPTPQPVELSPGEKRERALAELRSRYVADDITVEQYEQELDRLLREK